MWQFRYYVCCLSKPAFKWYKLTERLKEENLNDVSFFSISSINRIYYYKVNIAWQYFSDETLNTFITNVNSLLMKLIKKVYRWIYLKQNFWSVFGIIFLGEWIKRVLLKEHILNYRDRYQYFLNIVNSLRYKYSKDTSSLRKENVFLMMSIGLDLNSKMTKNSYSINWKIHRGKWYLCIFIYISSYIW